MKYVLITSTAYPYAQGDKPGVVDGLRPQSLEKLTSRGLIPLVASAVMSDEMIDRLYAMADGVLFSGGSDIDASHYGKKNHPKSEVSEPARDRMELRLMHKALVDKKPVFAICRGAQILNIVQGGTLHQYIPDLCTYEIHGTGVAEGNRTSAMNMNATVVLNSKLHKYVNCENIRLTCNHKQSVDRLGNNLMISAYSGEGIAEVIEHTDPEYFCFGIQSHPEGSEYPDLELVYDAFASTVNKSRIAFTDIV